MADGPFRVLYLAGAGRSGSTLLECLLGQLPGAVAAGEVTHIWVRGFRENQLCGCGVPFRDCPFWNEVAGVAFGGMDRCDYETAETHRTALCRTAGIPRLLTSALRSRAYADRLSRYGDLLTRLYGAVASVSGARMVVDSSKYPAEAYLLRAVGGFPLAVVHLVRDSNAVAYAWQKRKVRPDVHWTDAQMARYPFLQTAAAWNVYNLAIEGLRSAGVAYHRVRYEDLVAYPRDTIAATAGLAGLEPGGLEFITEGAVHLASNHTASGNPVRLQQGWVSLQLDDEWRRAAPRVQRALVSSLTFPLRWRYGYRGWTGLTGSGKGEAGRG